MRYKPSLCVFLLLLSALACSDGDVRVTTQSNQPIVSEDGTGASIAIAAGSADGTQNVNINSGSSSLGRELGYSTAEGQVHTFCLDENESGGTAMILENGIRPIVFLEEGSCAAIELGAGDHTILLNEWN